jgi:hypothetical protein
MADIYHGGRGRFITRRRAHLKHAVKVGGALGMLGLGYKHRTKLGHMAIGTYSRTKHYFKGMRAARGLAKGLRRLA